MINKIVSGGQTGSDRAGLDVAIKLKIPHGGWCPRGRMAEDGVIPNKYLLECPTDSDSDLSESNIYNERTKLNIRDSDGTLIFVPTWPLPESITDGTNLTIHETENRNKPHFIVDISKNQSPHLIADWIIKNKISVLNIAGPRESQCPGIYAETFSCLENLFQFMLEKKMISNSSNRYSPTLFNEKEKSDAPKYTDSFSLRCCTIL